MLKYLLEKEFKQFKRNAFLPKLIVGMPIIMLLILPWAADMETKNVNLVVVDNDHTPYSERMTEKAVSSQYFKYAAAKESHYEAMSLIELGDADVILEIPDGFEENLVKAGVTDVLISANSVNGTKALLGSYYLSNIVASFAADLRIEHGATLENIPKIEVASQTRFNSRMNYKFYMLPAMTVVLLTLLGGFLPALNIVGEKEAGTIEQINVTPVPKATFILSKLIPYWIIGLSVLTLSLIIIWLVYGLVPAGSLLTIYLATVLYGVALSGFGLVISNYSSNMQQAMFVMFFFMLIFLLMSGLFTPVKSMPDWAQTITVVNPLRYFIDVMRSVYLKGSTAIDLWIQFLALFMFAVFSNSWAVLSYKKSH